MAPCPICHAWIHIELAVRVTRVRASRSPTFSTPMTPGPASVGSGRDAASLAADEQEDDEQEEDERDAVYDVQEDVGPHGPVGGIWAPPHSGQ